MRILFLSQWFPCPPDNGSKLRVLGLLRGLARDHEVTLLTFADPYDADPDLSELRSLCREVLVVPARGFEPNSFRARLGFLSPTPRWLVNTYSPRMVQSIEEALARSDFDLVIASQAGTAVYGQHLHGIPALFEEVEVGLLYEQYARATSPRHRFRYGLTWTKHRHYLARLLREYRACTVVSKQERALLSKAVPGYRSIEVIPNCLELANYTQVQETAQPRTLVFTGSFRYFPNHEAMIWFLESVYPRILAGCPDALLMITGDHAGKALPATRNVILTGHVDDVRPLIARAWVSLAPILSGGGTRLKILEAMALRTPIVATAKGAEGLEVQHGEHLLIADTPDAFAEAVVRVMSDPELRAKLTNNAYQLVRSTYDWAIVQSQFLGLVERMTCTPEQKG